jgi:hypothetical protein
MANGRPLPPSFVEIDDSVIHIVGTRGNDIGSLMAALDEMAVAYGVQRWLWITVSVRQAGNAN